ncbi:hypothetical protein COCNU_14G000080 [Cocos nucifera]|uniref:ESCRT-II complex subunit VPS25 n=1 Tax=Cocos nucifera TaxID=13894 RepID=A0A8K0NCF8_COCNU|nr:hypothetical protein COCNU_14G000080 [Cocos nucifera]
MEEAGGRVVEGEGGRGDEEGVVGKEVEGRAWKGRKWRWSIRDGNEGEGEGVGGVGEEAREVQSGDDGGGRGGGERGATCREGSLSHEAREVFLNALVAEGHAEWMDKSHRKCLILWRRIQDWAAYILNFVKENGFEDSVMTVEDIRSGIETRGTELAGIDRGVLMRALRLLEQKGKAAIFKGTSADDEGVKFSA